MSHIEHHVYNTNKKFPQQKMPLRLTFVSSLDWDCRFNRKNFTKYWQQKLNCWSHSPDYDRAVPQFEMTCQLNIIFKTWKYYLWGLCTVCVQLYSAGVVYTCTGVIAVTRLSVYERLWSETHHVSVVKVKINEKNSFTVSQRKYQLYQWHLNISTQFYDLLWKKIMWFW